MPELRPFRALRYGDEAAGGLSLLMAPPYDVIAPEEARELRDRSPHNAVRLVLPEGDAPDRYAAAAARLEGWREERVLLRDDTPAVYAYAQTFEHGGERRTRTGFFAALRLEPFEDGRVLPHERTHRGPKEDRLALTEATDTQLSAVFLAARDPEGRMAAVMERVRGAPPGLLSRTPDGIGHALWRVEEPELRDALCEAAGGDSLLILDGHHRYETALELARRHPGRGGAAYVLAYVVSARDPGLEVLPTHRTVHRPPEGGWHRLLERGFELREATDAEPAALAAEAERAPRAGAAGAGATLGFRAADEERGWLLRARPEAFAGRVDDGPAGRADPHLASLAPVVFARLVLRTGFGLDADGAAEGGLLSYHRDAGDALRAAGCAGGGSPDPGDGDAAGTGAAFFLPALTLAEVWRVSEAGGRLPPKSTYFWPKVPSGLLFRPLVAP